MLLATLHFKMTVEEMCTIYASAPLVNEQSHESISCHFILGFKSCTIRLQHPIPFLFLCPIKIISLGQSGHFIPGPIYCLFSMFTDFCPIYLNCPVDILSSSYVGPIYLLCPIYILCSSYVGPIYLLCPMYILSSYCVGPIYLTLDLHVAGTSI